MLLAFVSFLAPLVYHQNHESHPQTKRGESRMSTFAHHRVSSLQGQHRSSIAKSYGHVGHIEDDDEDDVTPHGEESFSLTSSSSNCNKRGVVVNNKCQCLKLWRGRTCEEGPNIFSFKSKSSEKLSSSRKVETPLQFEGDFTTNKEQLRKTCEDGNIKVFLPGKVPPIDLRQSAHQAMAVSRSGDPRSPWLRTDLGRPAQQLGVSYIKLDLLWLLAPEHLLLPV